MASKISLIFLVTLTAGITFGIAFSSKAVKLPSSVTTTKKIPENITDLVNFVTLNETLTFWNKTDFHFCFNKESSTFNIPLLLFGQQLEKSLKNFIDMSLTNSENDFFVRENYRCVKENYKIIDEVRSSIYLETQKPQSAVRKLNELLPPKKRALEVNFVRLDDNFPKIEKGANNFLQHEKLEEIKKIYKEKVQNIKSKSIQFVKDIKQCMDIS